MFVVISGDFCRFKLVLPSLLFLLKERSNKNNSDGKASLKRKKFIVVNRPYFVPHTNPYKVLKFSTVPLVSSHRVTQRVTLAFSRDVGLGYLFHLKQNISFDQILRLRIFTNERCQSFKKIVVLRRC